MAVCLAVFGHGLAEKTDGQTNPKLPTLFVVGDSTANNNANGGRGWGEPFIALFDASKINVPIAHAPDAAAGLLSPKACGTRCSPT